MINKGMAYAIKGNEGYFYEYENKSHFIIAISGADIFSSGKIAARKIRDYNLTDCEIISVEIKEIEDDKN